MSSDQPVTAVMTAEVLALTADQTIEAAVAALVGRGISGAPVVDEANLLVGLLDDTDLLVSEAKLHAPTTVEILGAYFTLPGERHRFADELRQALGRTVGDVMDPAPRTLRDDATVGDAATIILDHEVSRVPILDAEGHVAGIVTRGDLVRALYRPAG